jgi:hypothetical protein
MLALAVSGWHWCWRYANSGRCWIAPHQWRRGRGRTVRYLPWRNKPLHQSLLALCSTARLSCWRRGTSGSWRWISRRLVFRTIMSSGFGSFAFSRENSRPLMRTWSGPSFCEVVGGLHLPCEIRKARAAMLALEIGMRFIFILHLPSDPWTLHFSFY